MDAMDAQCLHAVAYDALGNPIATGRLLPDGHIGRMAVRKRVRGTGVGAKVLNGLMQQAKKRGDQRVVLSSQTHAKDFYLKHGFTVVGAEFMEAGIPHVEMERLL
nr:GNAT family N-acetyltransferase [Massilia sp. TS11]